MQEKKSKKKPTAEEMRLRAQKWLKDARELEKAEKHAADVKLGQMLRDYLSKKISHEELITEGGKVVGLESNAGGRESGS